VHARASLSTSGLVEGVLVRAQKSRVADHAAIAKSIQEATGSLVELLAMAKKDEREPALSSQEIYKNVLNVSRSTFHNLRKAGRFPAPSFYLGPNTPRWLLSDVRRAIEELKDSARTRDSVRG
jgi:predicted DNA-binding transcriptional regulator AlpA